jgi:phospholipid/cholesterol/gamma-HCH transport system ATP-binding protein
MSEEKPIIEARNLTIGYGDEPVLEDVTFDVRRGEVFVILGGSGCGKSTLLKHLIGLYPPMKGEIRIEGRDLVTAEGDERRAILKRIGVSYQSGALFGSMTLAENVRLPLEEYTDLPEDALALLAWMKLQLVGLESYVGSLPSEVSGGMQKRAAIARAMALDPAVVFLDEPSAGLDPITSAELDALILRLNKTLGMTFVIVTHELPSIYAIADRVIMLDKERKGIIAEGVPAELRDHSTEPFVRRFFHREAEATT